MSTDGKDNTVHRGPSWTRPPQKPFLGYDWSEVADFLGVEAPPEDEDDPEDSLMADYLREPGSCSGVSAMNWSWREAKTRCCRPACAYASCGNSLPHWKRSPTHWTCALRYGGALDRWKATARS